MRRACWSLKVRCITVCVAVSLGFGLMVLTGAARGQQSGGRRGRGNRPRLQPKDTIPGLVPLTEMTKLYQGEDGGLYGGGKDEPSKAHKAAAERATAAIQPLDANGKPSPDGKIVLLNPASEVQDAFDGLGFAEIFTIARSRQEALSAL